VVESFSSALKSWRTRRKTDPSARPPYRRRYDRVQWKSSVIRVRDERLILSNGRGNAPLVVPWRWGVPTLVELGWTGVRYELRCISTVQETTPKPPGEETVGVDRGEVHLAVVHDGQKTTIFNGRALRARRQYQNKLKAVLAARQSRLTKGSRRWRTLNRSKRTQLRKLNHQILDILHTQTTALVSTLHASRVQLVVIGDVRNIRQCVKNKPSATRWSPAVFGG
jgi:putative transposase